MSECVNLRLSSEGGRNILGVLVFGGVAVGVAVGRTGGGTGISTVRKKKVFLPFLINNLQHVIYLLLVWQLEQGACLEGGGAGLKLDEEAPEYQYHWKEGSRSRFTSSGCRA